MEQTIEETDRGGVLEEDAVVDIEPEMRAFGQRFLADVLRNAQRAQGSVGILPGGLSALL